MNVAGVFVVPKIELVFDAVLNPRLFPNVCVPPNRDVVLLLDFPNNDVLFVELNPPPNGLLPCTPNVCFSNMLLVGVVLARPS